MRTRPEPRSVGRNRLVARDSHPTFFLISLASKCRFEFCLLTRGNKERVFLSVFDNLLCHNLALETAQCALNRFTLINSNYSHSLVAFLLFDQLKLIKHGEDSAGQAKPPLPSSKVRQTVSLSRVPYKPAGILSCPDPLLRQTNSLSYTPHPANNLSRGV